MVYESSTENPALRIVCGAAFAAAATGFQAKGPQCQRLVNFRSSLQEPAEAYDPVYHEMKEGAPWIAIGRS
jgi:hypothetical protein